MMLGSGRGSSESPPSDGATVAASATAANSATSVFIARFRMSAACMLSTSFRVCMRRGSKEAQTVSSRLPNDLLTGCVCDDRHQLDEGGQMSLTLVRPWFLVLAAVLLLAAIVIGEALGVASLGIGSDAPTAMPGACPPDC